jgi:hypothetical protein
MARVRDLNRKYTWRQRHQRQSSSGLSVAAFWAREGISAEAFYAWRHRLAARSLPARLEPPLFVPLDLDSPHRQTSAALGRGLEVELPNQVRLRLDIMPEPEWLCRVVAALVGLPRKEATR